MGYKITKENNMETNTGHHCNPTGELCEGTIELRPCELLNGEILETCSECQLPLQESWWNQHRCGEQLNELPNSPEFGF